MKLLIAEDELLAREGISQLIPPVFNEVRTAGNGLDALALAEEMEPDVALCDVRMPKMNGIELARRLRLRFPAIHILFISAYSDKEYLKSAISVQADGYLEKPIDEAELLSHLDRIVGEIRARARREQQQSGLADLFARQQILPALFHRSEESEQALAIHPALTEAVLRAGRYLPVSVRMQWPGGGAPAQYGFYSEIRLAELLGRISPNFLFSSFSESQIGVLFYGDSLPAAAACEKQLRPLLESLREANPQVLNVCACIGEICRDPARLHDFYHAAHLQVQWMCFTSSEPYAVSALTRTAPPPEDRSARFETLLRTHQLDEAKELVRRQTEEILRGGVGSIEQVRRYYELLLSMCLRVNSGENPEYRYTRTSSEILFTFSKLSTLQEISRFLCVRIDDIAPSMNLGEDAIRQIREVQAYIRQNLSDPALSVQAVADRVGLSENYLGALFKRETGQTLHRVIVDLRMERAKYLLLNHCRVQEVAQRCGFSSAGYFHSVFKKYTGLSPAAFVEKNRTRPEGKTEGRGED